MPGQVGKFESRERAKVSAVNVNQGRIRIRRRRPAMRRTILIEQRERRKPLSHRDIQLVRRIQSSAHRVADKSAATHPDHDAGKKSEQSESHFRVRRVEPEREPYSHERRDHRNSQHRECRPRDPIVDTHPRRRPERYQDKFVEPETAPSQQRRTKRAKRLERRCDPRLFNLKLRVRVASL